MKEQLYTVPVNDAFDKGLECPVCAMYDKLEKDAVSFMMGPSYMEDDIRMETNEKGFCGKHLTMLLSEKNRLGLSLILKTHLDEQIYEAKTFAGKKIKPKSLLKKNENTAFSEWAYARVNQCYICDRINLVYPHYIGTVFYLYRKEPEFREKFEQCKGFCQKHAADLIEKARTELSGEMLQGFYEKVIALYTDNLKRVADDLDWFANKFDYRYKDEPWKNAKDSIERAALKTNGIVTEEK